MSVICERYRLYLAEDRYNLLRVVPLLGCCPGLGLISCVSAFGFLGVEPTPVVEACLEKAAFLKGNVENKTENKICRMRRNSHEQSPTVRC